MRSLAFLLLLPCLAWGQTGLSVSVASYHFHRGENYCEFNPGLGLLTRFHEDLTGVAGAYRNSGCNTSAYVGGIWEPWRPFGARAGFILATATGYGGHALTGIGGATMLIEHKGLGYRLMFIPAAKNGVLALFLEKWF